MATYAIGDIHGCWHTLQRLLTRIGFSSARDRLLLTGDLVNRGPFSREVLLWARENEDHVHFVLGNHEMHLLGAALGAEGFRERDALRPILDSADGTELVDWVRTRPLLLIEDEFVLVHAGLLPRWTLDEAWELATRCSETLQGDEARLLLEESWRLGRQSTAASTNQGSRMDQGPGTKQGSGEIESFLSGQTLFLHAATLLRLVDARGEMVENFVKGEDEIPAGTVSWFDAVGRKWKGQPVIFGHWAMLGLMLREDAWCLDSGCVWGGTLTAVRLEDQKVFQEARADEDAPKS